MWWIEGISKALIFLSFWFATPMLPRWAVQMFAGPVSFLTALYAVGLLAAAVNNALPPDWKFAPEPSQMSQEQMKQVLIEEAARRNAAPSSGQQTPDKPLQLTRSPILDEHARWKEQYDRSRTRRFIAGILIIAGTLMLTIPARWAALCYLLGPEAVAGTQPTPREVWERRCKVIGAWLFAAGMALDFYKWWLSPAAEVASRIASLSG